MLRKVTVIIIKFVIVLTFLYGLLSSFLSWAGYSYAQAPDCSENANSFFNCNSDFYLTSAILASVITIILFSTIVVIARKELKNKKAN